MTLDKHFFKRHVEEWGHVSVFVAANSRVVDMRALGAGKDKSWVAVIERLHDVER